MDTHYSAVGGGRVDMTSNVRVVLIVYNRTEGSDVSRQTVYVPMTVCRRSFLLVEQQ